MKKLKVAILEDSKLLLDDLKADIEKTDLLEIVFCSQTSEDFIEKAKSSHLDAVLLDIELNGDSMSGIDVSHKLGLPTLFISGKTREFLSEIEDVTFSLDVPVGHILKPINARKLEKVLPKFIAEVGRYTKSIAKQVITIRVDREWEKIKQEDIVFIETITDGSNNKTIYFTNRKPGTLHNFSFSKMEEKGFDLDLFVEPHFSYRVNKNYVELYDGERLRLTFNDGSSEQKTKKIPVSDSNKIKIRKLFSK